MVNRIRQKRIAEPFLRGPMKLAEFKKFRDLGMGALVLYLNYHYKYQMQAQQLRRYNKWWPDPNDPTWVKITNSSKLPFFRRPQQKYAAVKKCLAADLIEIKPKRKYEAAVIRIKKHENKKEK